MSQAPFPLYHQRLSLVFSTSSQTSNVISYVALVLRLTALGWAGGPCLTLLVKLSAFLRVKAPLYFFDDFGIDVSSGLFIQFPCYIESPIRPVLSVLASGVFRFDATALSLATVRWHGFLPF